MLCAVILGHARLELTRLRGVCAAAPQAGSNRRRGMAIDGRSGPARAYEEWLRHFGKVRPAVELCRDVSSSVASDGVSR